MSLSINDIEAILLGGVHFAVADNEYSARLDAESDTVTFVEMSALGRVQLHVEAILDRCHASGGGSDLLDEADLKRLLTTFVG